MIAQTVLALFLTSGAELAKHKQETIWEGTATQGVVLDADTVELSRDEDPTVVPEIAGRLRPQRTPVVPANRRVASPVRSWVATPVNQSRPMPTLPTQTPPRPRVDPPMPPAQTTPPVAKPVGPTGPPAAKKAAPTPEAPMNLGAKPSIDPPTKTVEAPDANATTLVGISSNGGTPLYVESDLASWYGGVRTLFWSRSDATIGRSSSTPRMAQWLQTPTTLISRLRWASKDALAVCSIALRQSKVACFG